MDCPIKTQKTKLPCHQSSRQRRCDRRLAHWPLPTRINSATFAPDFSIKVNKDLTSSNQKNCPRHYSRTHNKGSHLRLVISRKLVQPWLLFFPIRGLHHKRDLSLPVTSLGVQGWRSGESTRLPRVARVRFPDPASNAGWVSWFSTLHRAVFSGYSGFPLFKNQNLTWLC